MIGLVIATHARLGEELVAAASMIIGPSSRVRAVSIQPGDGVEEIRTKLGKAMAEVNTEGDGVIVMTDMFGGTPSNISLAFLDSGKVEVLTGVNLPMVLKFFNAQDRLSLDELAALLKAYGQQGISQASDFLNHRD